MLITNITHNYIDKKEYNVYTEEIGHINIPSAHVATLFYGEFKYVIFTPFLFLCLVFPSATYCTTGMFIEISVFVAVLLRSSFLRLIFVARFVICAGIFHIK